jgi:hypothetical protein
MVSEGFGDAPPAVGGEDGVGGSVEVPPDSEGKSPAATAYPMASSTLASARNDIGSGGEQGQASMSMPGRRSYAAEVDDRD